MGKLRPTEVRRLALGHGAGEWDGGDSNQAGGLQGKEAGPQLSSKPRRQLPAGGLAFSQLAVLSTKQVRGGCSTNPVKRMRWSRNEHFLTQMLGCEGVKTFRGGACAWGVSPRRLTSHSVLSVRAGVPLTARTLSL